MLEKIIKSILEEKNHSPKTSFYTKTQSRLLKELNKNNLKSKKKKITDISKIGKIIFPYYSMGAINSLHLFGLDEIIIFCYYYSSRFKYKNVADIGGNIGLHSIIMSKFFNNIDCYEPDPLHVKKIRSNLKLNKISNVKIFKKAVSNKKKKVEFIRVLGNTTGSHIKGSKQNPYGKLKTLKIECVKFSKMVKKYDFIKIDTEGEEANLIKDTKKNDWKKTDAILEVGTRENAIQIYKHLKKLKMPMYSQKNNWRQVRKINQMPFSHKEGSLFISKNNIFELEKI